MGRSPSDHCAAISAKFATLFQHANVAATDFVRTTEERHIQAVQHFWQTLLHGGHIYRRVIMIPRVCIQTIVMIPRVCVQTIVMKVVL